MILEEVIWQGMTDSGLDTHFRAKDSGSEDVNPEVEDQ